MPPPFRLRPLEVPEQDIHETFAALCHRLVAPPCQWAFYPAGAVQLTAAQAAKLNRMGLRRGWPDFIFLMPGRTYGLELKRQGGRLSKTRVVRTRRGAPRILEGQEDVFPLLAAAGMTLAVVYSVDAAVGWLEHWDIPLRGTVT